MDENKVKTLHDEILEVVPGYRSYFKCPLCLQDFTYKQVFSEDPKERALSNAHTIPESLGGREYTITCKDCNAEAGRSFEGRVIDKRRYIYVMTGTLKTDVKRITIEASEEQLPGRIGWEDGNLVIRSYHRQRTDQLFPNLSDVKFTIHKSFKIEEHDDLRYVFHIAYLSSFHNYGYGYLLGSNGQMRLPEFEEIRQFTRGEINEISERLYFFSKKRILDQGKGEYVVTANVVFPSFSFLLIMTGNVAMFFPPLSNEGIDEYRNFDFREKMKEFRFVLRGGKAQSK
jgi:hypothetical protein